MRFIQQISILCLIVLPTITFSQKNVYATQIDTIKIHKSNDPLVFFTKIDTIGRQYFVTKIKVYDPRKETLLQTINDTSSSNFGGGRVNYLDINLDGYKDIEINCGVNNLIPIYSFWLYDRGKREYSYSSEFSRLHRYYIDRENKEIKSVSQFVGGIGGYECLYRVENGRLFKVIDNLSQGRESESNIYYNNKKIQTIRMETYDTGYNNDTLIFKIYAVNGSSEILIGKSWRRFISNLDISYHSKDKGIFEKFNDNWYELIKKEEYSYEELTPDTLTKKVKKYKAVGNGWEEVDEFN